MGLPDARATLTGGGIPGRLCCVHRAGDPGKLECQEATPVNTDHPELMLLRAEDRVLKIQAKLHRWARQEPRRRFDDLFNLVTDAAFLLVAWARVRGN
jgi:hypothetical protein